MRMRILVLLLVLASVAHADPVKKCEQGRRLVEQFCEAPTPVTTATPGPTNVADCSDGRFLLVDGGYTLSLVRQFLIPGRVYHYCATVPAGIKAAFLAYQTTNLNNAGCNKYGATLTSPSGEKYPMEPVVQPSAPPYPETGVWGIEIKLEIADQCPTNLGIDQRLWGWSY